MSELKEEQFLEGVHLAVLQDWIQKGKAGNMPEPMILYLEQLDFARAQWNQASSPQKIIKALQTHYEDLDKLTAKSRFEDALTFFYLDKNVKQQIWRNALFEKQMQLAEATILSATKPEDYDTASKILERAYRMKGLDKDEEESVPDSVFQLPTTVLSLRPEDIGMQSANRNALAKMIDNMNIEESEKIRIKQDAGIEPRKVFERYEQKADTT